MFCIMPDMDFENTVKHSLADGNPVFGARTKTVSPLTVEVFAELGVDFVWVDLEHFGPAPLDSRAIESLVRAADAAGVELLIRIPDADPVVVRKVFDTGVRIVLVSRVESAEEARTAVEASKFTYNGGIGRRGSGSARANSWGFDGDEYFDREDQETMVGAMLETEPAVEHVDDIVAVPELDFVFLGAGDLAVNMGYPGESERQRVQDALEQLQTTARDAGVTLGRVASDPDVVNQAVEDGFRLLRVGDDIDDMVSVLNDKLNEIRSFE